MGLLCWIKKILTVNKINYFFVCLCWLFVCDLLWVVCVINLHDCVQCAWSYLILVLSNYRNQKFVNPKIRDNNLLPSLHSVS